MSDRRTASHKRLSAGAVLLLLSSMGLASCEETRARRAPYHRRRRLQHRPRHHPRALRLHVGRRVGDASPHRRLRAATTHLRPRSGTARRCWSSSRRAIRCPSVRRLCSRMTRRPIRGGPSRGSRPRRDASKVRTRPSGRATSCSCGASRTRRMTRRGDVAPPARSAGGRWRSVRRGVDRGADDRLGRRLLRRGASPKEPRTRPRPTRGGCSRRPPPGEACSWCVDRERDDVAGEGYTGFAGRRTDSGPLRRWGRFRSSGAHVAEAPRMPIRRGGGYYTVTYAAVWDGTEVLVVGGTRTPTASDEPLARGVAYDPTTNRWRWLPRWTLPGQGSSPSGQVINSWSGRRRCERIDPLRAGRRTIRSERLVRPPEGTVARAGRCRGHLDGVGSDHLGWAGRENARC